MPEGQTVAGAIREAAGRLARVSDTARLDAEWLMAHALGCTRSDLLLRHMAAPEPAGFAALVERRLAHEPVAYILGHAEFYGLEFAVSPAVLIPRADSETLIEAARAYFAGDGLEPARILDLGTGSGCLLLGALSLWPGAEGLGLERSEPALAVAEGNARALGFASRARMLAGDWYQPDWAEGLGQFDLILANPPYVEAQADLAANVRDHEPHSALFAGAEGLDDYRILIPRLPALLAPGGVAVVEIGHAQAEAVAAIAESAGLASHLHRDLGNRPRALELIRKGGVSS